MPEMDTASTEFDPALDEPTWNVIIDTRTKQYSYKGVGTEQKNALVRLMEGVDYRWTVDGNESYIWYKPVERVVITKGRTKREMNAARQRAYDRRRVGRYYG